MKKIFALADCNNFYASCERMFRPELNGRPVVVLSNNDGCVIARSNEAKKLGVPMGAPYYKFKRLMQENDVVVFSSNYQLYGDMSRRVMESLQMFVPDVEVYSIDEAFLSLDDFQHENLLEKMQDVRAKLFQWLGMPISFGIAPTKTLAKVANHVAKKSADFGVFDICDEKIQNEILARLPVEEIWGISNRWGEKLRRMGIETALALKNADAKFIRKHLSVVGERIVYELRGVSCIDLDLIKPNKTIISSKSFGKAVLELEDLEEAIANYAWRACEKMRAQKSKAQALSVFVKTNRFNRQDAQYSNSAAIALDFPSSDSSVIIATAKRLIQKIYWKGYKYKKCGIMLLDLVPETHQQENLFVKNDSSKSDELMQVLDSINKTVGVGSVFYASQGTKREWAMRSDSRSPRYSTKWDELPLVY